MVDDVASPGIQPNAQHVFALSCGKKTEDSGTIPAPAP
jgi:hypothetical protein